MRGLIISFLLVALAGPCAARSPFDIQYDVAFVALLQGHLKEAETQLTQEISRTEEPLRKGMLLRDLVQVCATAFNWECVAHALKAVPPLLKAHPQMALIYPDFALYELRLNSWFRQDAYVAGFIERGGPDAIAAPVRYRTLYSELQLAAHDYYLQHLDGRGADDARSMALMGLLLSEPDSTYANSKVLVEFLESALDAQDVVGAFSVMIEVDRFLSRTLLPGSVLRARYLNVLARALSFGNAAYPFAAQAFVKAAEAWRDLEIDEIVKRDRMAVASSLASAAMVLAGNVDEAKAIHARHPMASLREQILQRGFETATEFYFAISEVLVAVSAGGKPDPRWRAILEREVSWNGTDFGRAELASYRTFALGLLDAADGNVDDGHSRIITAAKDRLGAFDQILRASFEGFQIAGLVDKLVIMSGLTAASARGGDDSVDFMVRASEVLGRNLRHRLVDTAAMLAAQPDQKARRDAQAYIELADRKRDWELQKIRQLVAGTLPKEPGDVLTDYPAAVSKLSALKQRFQSQRQGPTAGLPSLKAIQGALSPNEAYVGYFGHLSGFGRVCVRKDRASFSLGTYDVAIGSDIVALASATAAFPTDLAAASAYPVPAAVRVRSYLFGGLESCLTPGTHVTVALPPEFASVPLGALLASEPPRRNAGYDLAKAPWLIRDLSFSVVISARHMLATRTGFSQAADLAYFGIGDPDLGDQASALRSAAFMRGGLKTPNGLLSFVPLPETAAEVRSAAAAFGATNASTLLGKEATENALRTKPLARYDVLHFATHGLMKQDAVGLEEGGLILTPGQESDTFDDGLLSASEISKLTLAARLVILSACNTARYDIGQASRGAQDLQAAFTIAGAPTVVASLWAVDSLATQQLINGFISTWRKQKTRDAATALSIATRSFLKAADALRQHPSYWAAFTIIGNGSVTSATPSRARAEAPSAFVPLPGFSSTGDVLHAVALGSDMLYSLISEWDGKKMNGILSRRSPSGSERWRIASRDIGTGRIAVGSSAIFLLGYDTAAQPAYPVIRAFDFSGRALWTKPFPDLGGLVPADAVATDDGLAVLLMPDLVPVDKPHDVVLLSIAKDGSLRKSVPLERQSASAMGGTGRLAMWNGRLAAAVTASPTQKADFAKKQSSGLPSFCWEGLGSSLYELDPQSLEVKTQRKIDGLKTTSIAAGTTRLYVGGEITERCGVTGIGGIAVLEDRGEAKFLWRDNDVFSSSVRGLAVRADTLWVAVDRRKNIRLGVGDLSRVSDYSYKHWSEATGMKNDGSLLKLSSTGAVLARDDLSTGSNLFLQGVVARASSPILYGSLGGVAASTPLVREAARRRPKPSNTWPTDLFGFSP